jgi:Lipopolysaccharide-assembly
MFSARLYLFLIFCLLCVSCRLTLNNSYIDYNIYKTVTIEQFECKAANAPPQSGQQFSERFKLKILSDTRLKNIDIGGDYLFTGELTRYELGIIAPQANETVSLQRLTVAISVSCIDNKNADKSWTQQFSPRFANFPADTDLNTVQEQLLREIYEQILEDVFNKSFNAW